jgi:hypothetical protein
MIYGLKYLKVGAIVGKISKEVISIIGICFILIIYAIISSSMCAELTNETCSPALVNFTGSNFRGETIRADTEFINSLNKINDYARANNVRIYVTSSFRSSNKGLTGVVAGVEPAKLSNHLVGHAIDMNVLYGEKMNKLCNSKCLGKDPLPEGVNGFIKAIQEDPDLRWGGDFSKKDPVHIDDNLNSNIEAWKARYEAVQRSYKEKSNATNTITYDVEWNDIDMIAYPPGEELATYYNVQFNLTSANTGENIATWTNWIRVPGGHTHYGAYGWMQIEANPCDTLDQLINLAEVESGLEFTEQPGDYGD